VQTPSERSRAEAERQLVASTERYREVVASMAELGRPEAGQHVAVKAVGRAGQLVSFALMRAAEVGVAFERLVELTGWEPDVVRAGLERALPELRFVARLAPAGADAREVPRLRPGSRRPRACRISPGACSRLSTTRRGRRRPPS
jgi:hypothetical protein